MNHPPWDPGLQNERTGLAWQRTVLAGLTCSLLVARLLVDVSWPLAMATGFLALLGTAALGGMAIRRFRRHADALGADRPIGGGQAPALITLVVALTALGALLFALTA